MFCLLHVLNRFTSSATGIRESVKSKHCLLNTKRKSQNIYMEENDVINFCQRFFFIQLFGSISFLLLTFLYAIYAPGANLTCNKFTYHKYFPFFDYVLRNTLSKCSYPF